MYTFNSRIRYSEVNQHCQLTLSNITNYFQDCTNFQSEDLGIGIQYCKNQKRAWILSAWQIIVNRFPMLGEEITVGTWVTTTKGIYTNRNFVLKDKNGNDCAVGNAIWVYLDIEKGIPCRITEDIMSIYQKEEPYPMEYAPRKIAVPKELTEKERNILKKASEKSSIFQRELWLKSEQEAIAQLKKKGVEFINVDKTAFRKITQKIFLKYSGVDAKTIKQIIDTK